MWRTPTVWITIVVCMQLVVTGTAEEDASPRPRVIAGFGSSVCYGSGDHVKLGGYIGRLGALLKDRGWTVLNVSRGGDNTVTIQDRWEQTDQPPSKPVKPDAYLLQHDAGYVIIGLSLGNEGIRSDDPVKRAHVTQRFRSGMQTIIERCRREGMRVVVSNCYAHSHFIAEHYAATRAMNLEINSWDVPSINMLGVIDDGQGRWVDGFQNDPGHPSAGGFEEMFLAIVPTLFDALESGKPLPAYSTEKEFARVDLTEGPALEFRPEDRMHSFAMSFRFRTSGDCDLATVVGKTAEVQPYSRGIDKLEVKPMRVVDLDQTIELGLSVGNGELVYVSGGASRHTSVARVDDRAWHFVTLTNNCARGNTLLVLDGQQVTAVEERIVPTSFHLGIQGACDVKDWFVHRSPLNLLEAQALDAGKMIQSSLEVYAPLTDRSFEPPRSIVNLAQSLSEATVASAGVESSRVLTVAPNECTLSEKCRTSNSR